jgi:predicted DsbA family dithiol-disulfide isomerase
MVALALCIATVAAAAELPEPCQELSGSRTAAAMEILAAEHPYDCCDDTIARCLEQVPVCRLAWRLAGEICRRVGEDQEAALIRRALSRRARSMLPGGERVEIDLPSAPVAGEGEPAVEVVVYACARCPFCSRLLPRLHEAVVSGPLRGKARLYFRVFPIRGHEHSKEGGLALVAAAGLDRFWEMLFRMYEQFDRFCVAVLPDWAEAAGMERSAFEALYEDPATREALVESKKEGLRNGVDVTPSVFIGGRRYVGDVTYDELLSVINEAHDNLTGRMHGRP